MNRSWSFYFLCGHSVFVIPTGAAFFSLAAARSGRNDKERLRCDCTGWKPVLDRLESLSWTGFPACQRRGMLTAVEFDNQMLRDAAEVGKVGTNAVLPAEFESATAVGSELRPPLPLLISRVSTKTPASITRIFVGRTH